MKRILILCLLGMALLSAQATITDKKEITSSFSRITPSINKDGWVLSCNSQTADGHITMVQIMDSNYNIVIEEYFDSYSCVIDISKLEEGSYIAKVFTEYSPVYSDGFTVN